MEDLIKNLEKEIKSKFEEIERIGEKNFIKVLSSFRKNGVVESDFFDSTGYGFNDVGREKLERVFAEIFDCEDSLVRSQIASGSHAISIVFFSLLKPGDELITITGEPYDTIQRIIGTKKSPLSLKDLEINYKELNIIEDDIDFRKIINDKTKMVFIQKSIGYGKRKKTLLNSEIKNYIKEIKNIKEDTIIFVDNCYGEFVEENEPTSVGADIIAGSLTKNPGGGIVPFGGYIAGKKNLIEKCSSLLSSPGIGKYGGAQINFKRLAFLGLFLAPHFVKETLKGMVFASKLLSHYNFNVFPEWFEKRGDIILGIEFKDKNNLIKFAQLIQKYSPVDSNAVLEPLKEDFYNYEVIMAGGTFTQGSSIELSFDAPIKEPYIGYLQGGLMYEYIKYVIIKIVEEFKIV
ncbi:MAG TPA: methionine gamma-lyase family protein [Caldisericia bacterium]|nr:methionine gamma-lyase family protein [Caldisericia bacterium]HQL66007.1 methionine gamma-lyase family protein [Caldisericia bacterium]HQO99859.1 methionine gamma-lyase family protein [Caldisericia bacterium]